MRGIIKVKLSILDLEQIACKIYPNTHNIYFIQQRKLWIYFLPSLPQIGNPQKLICYVWKINQL